LHAAHPNGLAEQLWHYDGSFVGSYVFYLLLGGVAALHADRAHGWVRAHPVTVVVVLLCTGAAAEEWYLRSVHHGVPLMAASDVFQAVMVPWCLAAITALFALGVAWADRRGTRLGSQVIKVGSDRSFGVFLVHPMLLLAWMLSPAGWLSTRIPALWSTIFAIVAVTSGSMLVVELIRRSPLSLMLTGKPRSRTNSSVRSGRSKPSVSAEPIRLGEIDILRGAGIDFYFGGTLFERYALDGLVSKWLALCRELGVTYVEVSNGTIPIDNMEKVRWVARLAGEFVVISEVGFKDIHRCDALVPARWISLIEQDLAAGAHLVTAEARENGRGGICRADGQPRHELVDEIIGSGIDLDLLVRGPEQGSANVLPAPDGAVGQPRQYPSRRRDRARNTGAGTAVGHPAGRAVMRGPADVFHLAIPLWI